MSHHRTTAAAAGLVLLLAAGCASPGGRPAAAPADEHAGHDMTAMTPIAATRAAGTAVTVSNFAFSPSTLRTTLGADVTWSFPDMTTHTATSTQGFFDSGSKSDGATFVRDFDSAGTYPYVCTIHPSMTGKVEVPLKATGSAANGWRVTWATSAASAESTYDVQVKRPGSSAWVALKTETTLRKARFNPARAGKYALRARTHLGASRSDWSPTRSLRIS